MDTSKIDWEIFSLTRMDSPRWRAMCCTVVIAAAALTACSTTPSVQNAAGVPALELDPSVRGPVSGVGIESQDILSMTDKMMRDLLATPVIAGRQTAPRIIIDGSDFANQGSQPINKDLMINRLRVELSRAAQGRVRFIGREYASAVDLERDLKREGVTDVGTTGLTQAQAGADFKLVGAIGTLDSYSGSSGLQQRYIQITFEMLDLETSELVWSNYYEFERAAADDVVYR